MQQQITVWVVNVQGLGAAFPAARLLSSPRQVFKCSISRRSESLSRTQGRRLGEDAQGEFNCVWDDRIAALQWVSG